MTAGALYDDGRVVLDEGGVTLRHYYFPTAASKRIRYDSIRTVTSRRLTWLTGRGRLWGSGHPRYWLPLDGGRTRKHTLIVLDLGTFIRPAFTPDDPDEVLRLLREHCGG